MQQRRGKIKPDSSWVKNDTGWWADSSIGDGEFVSAIQYLVGLGIINTNLQTNTQSSSDSSTSVSASSSMMPLQHNVLLLLRLLTSRLA